MLNRKNEIRIKNISGICILVTNTFICLFIIVRNAID